MKELFKLKTVQQVISLLERFEPVTGETTELRHALGRILFTDIAAPHDIPTFARACMDGYAVRAGDTSGATDDLPARLTVVGEVAMGSRPSRSLEPGQAMRIWTGGMMPEGADAVAMIEYSRSPNLATVEISRAASVLENVIQAGDDVKAGTVLLHRGDRLRPQDLGLLAGLGIAEVPVYRRVKAAVLSTGDEIVEVNGPLAPGRVRDMNSYSIGGLLTEMGAEVICLGIVPDTRESLRAAIGEGLERADMVLVSGGSSMGARDYTVQTFESFPGTEQLAHGIAVKPGKPTILDRRGNQVLWGLPGHAASAMVVFTIFVRPLLYRMSGEATRGNGLSTLKAVLSHDVESTPGMEEYIRVKIAPSMDGFSAHPIPGKSGLISTMVEADGLMRIPMEAKTVHRGDVVEVVLFGAH